jgi:diphosphomevalonate decarboxylase
MINYEEKYRKEALNLGEAESFNGCFTVKKQSPSNIALVKYWGKRHFQIPQNPSLSFTLNKSFTDTEIEVQYKKEKGISFDFYFDGKTNSSFEERMSKYLSVLKPFFPFIENLHLKIFSTNSFPHSSGIASSASAMSAFALCICSIEKKIFGTLQNKKEFLQKASFMARLGSGSAARSVWPGFVLWGETDSVEGSSNEFAIPLPVNIDKNISDIRDAILITSPEKKKISSSAGHGLMKDHPFAEARYKQANKNIVLLIKALTEGNRSEFIKIVEDEALTLHSLMMSSNPGFTLMNEKTWKIIDEIRNYRKTTGRFIAFTLDAGPNVHLLYLETDKDEILKFIEQKLVVFCDNGRWIDDGINL